MKDSAWGRLDAVHLGNATEQDYEDQKHYDASFIIVGVTAVGLAAVTYIGASMIENTMIDGSVARTTHLAQLTTSIAKTFDERAKKGEFDDKTAKTQAADMIRSLRYGDQRNQYFFGFDYTGVQVLNGADRSQEGQNTIDNKDPDGIPYVANMINVGKAGGGHTFYSYKRPDGTEPFPKVSSVANYEPWQWVIGTGSYIDDIYAPSGRPRGNWPAPAPWSC